MAYYRFEVESSLLPAEVESKVRAITRDPDGFLGSLKKGFFPFETPLVPFIGHVDSESFQIRRDIRYRNSFLPIILGRVEATPAGSHVRVTMRIHIFVAMFMSIWFSGVGFAIWATTIGGKSHGTFSFGGPLGMFAFGIALVSFCFFPEAMKAKKIIETTLKK
jgi:hypothetical protein